MLLGEIEFVEFDAENLTTVDDIDELNWEDNSLLNNELVAINLEVSGCMSFCATCRH